MKKPLIATLLILALVSCDQLAKQLVAHHISGRSPLVLIEGAAALCYAENPGITFGGAPLAVALPLLVALTTAVILLVLVGWQRLPYKRPIEHFGFAVVVAGSTSNLLDRALRGFVIDYVHLNGWPIFNLADVWILTGVVLLLLAPLRPRRGKRL